MMKTRAHKNVDWSIANAISCKPKQHNQAVPFVDNSPQAKNIAQLQAMTDRSLNLHHVQLQKIREMIDNSPQTKVASDPMLYNTSKPAQLNKQLGNSAKLAMARWKLKKTPAKKSKGGFKKWRRGREAQHLIPAAICKQYGIPEKLVNHADNGMMIPSGRPTTHHQRDKSLDKNKVFHIQKGLAHPLYNKTVSDYVKKKWGNKKISSAMFFKVAKELRLLHKIKRKQKWTHVDHIKIPKT